MKKTNELVDETIRKNLCWSQPALLAAPADWKVWDALRKNKN